MTIEKIIDDLLSHEITKHQATDRIRKILNGFRNNDAIEMNIKTYGITANNNHAVLELEAPYMGRIFDKGRFKGIKKVDVILIP